MLVAGRPRAGNGKAHSAARSGTSASPDSVGSMPTRSAIIPTNGTLRPPVPQPKPIMIDETVAALTGAIDWAKVTFTGSVD